MSKPNCFIVGAPRCGTTALAAYLADHPQVYFSAPKEPFYWSDDCDALRRETGIVDLPAYLSLFKGAEGHPVVAEGSTTYFQSPGAIERILDFNPAARFIVMLRNPIETVCSRHQQLLFCFDEEVRDFEEAWRLQADRRAGRRVPARSRTPQFLQYGSYGRYADALARFCELVPSKQRRVVLFDDFIAEPRQSHGETLAFLGLADDGRTEFPKIHDQMKYRFGWFHEFIRFPPAFVAAPVGAARRTLHRRFPHAMVAMRRVLRKGERRNPLRPEFREELRAYFRDDVQRISELLHRDLSHWTAGSSVGERS